MCSLLAARLCAPSSAPTPPGPIGALNVWTGALAACIGFLASGPFVQGVGVGAAATYYAGALQGVGLLLTAILYWPHLPRAPASAADSDKHYHDERLASAEGYHDHDSGGAGGNGGGYGGCGGAGNSGSNGGGGNGGSGPCTQEYATPADYSTSPSPLIYRTPHSSWPRGGSGGRESSSPGRPAA